MPVRGNRSSNITAGRVGRGAPAADAPATPPGAPASSGAPSADPAAVFDATRGTAAATVDADGAGTSALATRADDPSARAFTADGQRKWKVSPPGVDVIANDTGRGSWVEKWKSAKTGKWVHNYTQAYMEARSDKKFVANKRFGDVVPDIRKQLTKDLSRDGTKKQLCAAIVTLIDQAYFRVGNEESDDNGVYGVTTLEQRHVTFGAAGRVTFEYVGKKSVDQHRVVVDKQITKILKRLHAKAGGPNERMFQFKGTVIDASDVNDYLKTFHVTAKNFRTFHATRMLRDKLTTHAGAPQADRPGLVKAAFEEVAVLLGHTPEVCRASYVDPTVVEEFEKGGAS